MTFVTIYYDTCHPFLWHKDALKRLLKNKNHHAAYTLIMRRKFILKLVPAILIFTFACCNATPPPRSDDSSFSEFSDIITVEEEKDSAVKPSTEWDVDDIDISEIDLSRKLISFTFDDSPSRTLENIYAVFAAFNEENPECKASATVFFNGKLFDSQTPHLLYTAGLLGFELGNHTHSHYDLTTLSDKEITEEIDKTDELLKRVDGRERHLLRAPFGKINENVISCAKTPLIDWTIDTLDWTGVSEEEIYNTVFEQKFSGAIVLMHDGYGNTVSALKRFLPDLKAAGYQVVSVSKMVKAHGCHFQTGKVYIRARKQH
jgi:peptidoglycan/xylan/chitin deacetylase (PgdA/CDA1 family)